MASPEIEREIDRWTESCPLKRRSILSKPSTSHNSKYYDRLWNQCCKEMELDRETEKLAKLF